MLVDSRFNEAINKEHRAIHSMQIRDSSKDIMKDNKITSHSERLSKKKKVKIMEHCFLKHIIRGLKTNARMLMINRCMMGNP